MTETTAPAGGATAKLCRFAELGECDREPEKPTGPGRPPEYCDRPDHTKVHMFRRRQELKRSTAAAATTGEQPAPDLTRPVDYSTARVRDLLPAARDLLTHQRELNDRQGQIFAQLVEQLDTLADPGAAAVEVESVQQQAAEQIAHAEGARIAAEQQAAEAKASVQEAQDIAEAAAQLAIEAQEHAAEAEAAGRERAADAREQAAEDIERERAALDDEAEQVRRDAAEEIDAAQAEATTARTDAATAIQSAQDAAAAEAERIGHAADEKITAAQTAAVAATGRANAMEAERDRAIKARDQATTDRDEAQDTATRTKAKIKELTAEHDQDRKRLRTQFTENLTDLRAEFDQEREDWRKRTATVRDQAQEAAEQLRTANETADHLRRELTALAHRHPEPAAPDPQAAAARALVQAAAPFLAGTGKGLASKPRTALTALRTAVETGDPNAPHFASAAVAALAKSKLPNDAEGHQLRDALTAYTEAKPAPPEEIPGQTTIRVTGVPEADDGQDPI